MGIIILCLQSIVFVLNDHATTRVSEEIPDYDPHTWGAGPENGGLCEMNWLGKSPNNDSTQISCYIRSVINNLLRTSVNLYPAGGGTSLVSIVDLYEVIDDTNKTALQKVTECGYGFDRTGLVPNQLIERVCHAAKEADVNHSLNSTNFFTIWNVLDYEMSGIGLGRKDTAIDRHLSSFMFQITWFLMLMLQYGTLNLTTIE